MLRRPGESELHADARRLLQREGQHVKDVLYVDIDSVVFTTPLDEPRTAWLYRVGGHTRAFVECGMPAWPSIELPPPAPPAAVEPDEPPDYDGA